MNQKKLKCCRCDRFLGKDCFYKRKDKKRGYDYKCKECALKGTKSRTFEPINNGNKICKKCNEEKHISEFFVCRKNKDGRDGKCKKCENKRKLKMLHDSPKLRITENLRKRMRNVVNHKYGNSLELIGCTSEELKNYLASLFEDGMSWDNYGVDGWHIDHIIPCSSFDLTIEEQQKKCFHYTNLQPLWAKDNLEKSNKFRTALITGVNGQIGSYLAELLLSKNYKVTGISRRTATHSLERIHHLLDNEHFTYQEADVTDSHSMLNLISNNYDEVFHLAAQSHVSTSFDQPTLTSDINYHGTLNILNAIHLVSKKTKMYFAATSEMFGSSYSTRWGKKFQDENTIMIPQSPYAISKLAAYHAVRLYRSSYGLNVCSGIMFNNESPRRGELFVTKKITKWIKEFHDWKNQTDSQRVDFSSDPDYVLKVSPKELKGNEQITSRFPKLRLGNLDACRDWGHSKDTAKAIYLMLQQDSMDDYVISTGETRSIKEFLNEAFSFIGVSDWEPYVVIDPKFYRPAEVDYLRGDYSKARKELGWSPSFTFPELVKDMFNEDL